MVRANRGYNAGNYIKGNPDGNIDALGYGETVNYNSISLSFECNGWICGTLTEAMRIHRSSGKPIAVLNFGAVVN